MAFCNSCGANLAPGAQFCAKCGAAVAGTAATPTSVTGPPTGAPGPAAPKTGSSAVKIILIVVGVLVVFGVLGVATLAIIGMRIARNTHVTQEGDHVKVETPFGSVDANKDPAEVARDLGVDVYPGAQIQENGAQSASFGSMRTIAANFDTPDPADKVCSFYKSKFPSATVKTSDQDRCTIVSQDSRNILTINVEQSGDGSKFHIARVSK